MTLFGLLLAPADRASAGGATTAIVIEGSGWGHGVGLSQWGAHTMANRGRTTGEILGMFYANTTSERRGGPVRVVVDEPGGPARLAAPAGAEVRSPLHGTQRDGFPIRIEPGAELVISYDGRYRVDHPSDGPAGRRAISRGAQVCEIVECSTTSSSTSSTGSTTSEPTSTACVVLCPESSSTTEDAPDSTDVPVSSPEPVWVVPAAGAAVTLVDRSRSYRGAVEATAVTGRLRLVNELDVEDYLRGLAEVPSTWPPAALEAQTVAARTYALRTMALRGEICDWARCQVYIGTDGESRTQDAAVTATAGWILTYGGAVANTVYSSSAGGISASAVEGFGLGSDVPYLQPVRHDDAHPMPWTARFSIDEVGRRLGYPGTPHTARVSEVGPSGRALTITFDGPDGTLDVPAERFRRQLALRSTLYDISVETTTASLDELPDPADEAVHQDQLFGDIEAVAEMLATSTTPDDVPDLEPGRASAPALPAGPMSPTSEGPGVLSLLGFAAVALAAGATTFAWAVRSTRRVLAFNR